MVRMVRVCSICGTSFVCHIQKLAAKATHIALLEIVMSSLCRGGIHHVIGLQRPRCIIRLSQLALFNKFAAGERTSCAYQKRFRNDLNVCIYFFVGMRTI